MARKILLADDSVTAQNMGRKILADAGYEVITVNNGSAALKKIAEQKPDLIVLDVYMPGYSGLEVCQRLKDSGETARLPVLLTVGKLEPFKPEEAKRARADAFIVKPFEASELLSVLSKLEDKIVPRAESAKPGRLARANAALEEGRYDKSVAVEEDLGWKNRIAFPSKKKDKSAPKESDDAGVYESPRTDLRSVIERKLTDQHQPAKEERVDLGALAPEGLPKDVTPEEIAALAAAAAQVKGKILESKPMELAVEETHAKEPASTAAHETLAALPVEPLADAVTQSIEEKIEHVAAKIDSAKTVEPAIEAPAPEPIADAIAAITGVNSDSSSSHSDSSPAVPAHAVAEPVTMARAGSDLSRWTAVPVGLSAEEAAISLEQEMQQAYAAFAAAEVGHAGSVAAAPADPSVSSEFAVQANPVASETTVAEPVMSIPAVPAPEAAQDLSALAHASTDALRAAVQELETVAESYLPEPTSPAPAEHQPAPVAEIVEQPDSVQPAMVNPSEAPTVEIPQVKVSPLDQAQADTTAHFLEDPKTEDKKDESAQITSAASTTDTAEVAKPAFLEPPPSEDATGVSSEERETAIQPAAEIKEEKSSQESEAAETTAAAWASWRRIRESADAPAEKTADSGDASDSHDRAARAVAAGAEKTPEEASLDAESDPAAIASIVDSVLADLRPKIFEEISRKMGKKK